MSRNVLKCKTAPQTKYDGDVGRQGKFSSWVFFFPSFSILSDLGTKLHKRQDSNNSVLGDGGVGSISGLATRVILLCSSVSRDVVGEGQ